MHNGETVAGFPGLSTREREILDLAAEGLADKEIGSRLEIAHGTVRTYWIRLRRKMNVGTRGEAIAVNMRYRANQQLNAKAIQIGDLEREVDLRRRAESRLAASEHTLRQTLDNLPVMVFRYDRELRLIYMNPACRDSMLPDPESALGKMPDELTSDRDQAILLRSSLDQVFRTARPTKVRLRADERDVGRNHEIMLVPDLDEHGRVMSVLGTVYEFSELVDGYALVADLFKNAAFGVLVCDLEGKILFSSPVVSTTLGRSAAELADQPVDLIRAPMATKDLAKQADVMSGRLASIRYRVDTYHQSGAICPAEFESFRAVLAGAQTVIVSIIRWDE